MMQIFHEHKSMQFWYVSQIKLTLTSDSIYVIAKTNSNPWDHTEKKKKTPPVLGHGVNFVRNSNKTVYFQRYTPNREVKSHEVLHFRTLTCPTWCVTLFTKPCTEDLYIYRETPFNCPCTCLLLQFQKLASCGFHFFLGSRNGFTTEITPASHPTYMIESVSCHHGFIAALRFHTRRRTKRLRVMSWAEIKSTKSILKRAEYQPYTMPSCSV